MGLHKLLFVFIIVVSTISYSQSVTLPGTAGAGGISTGAFDQLKSSLGFKSANRGEKFRVDGSPYLFEDWDKGAIITIKDGTKLKFENVNIDGRRNKIVAKINSDSIYTFNSLAIKEAVINGKIFKNIIDPNDGPIKIYEIIAATPEFKILKDYTVDISEGSSNPMRGTTYSRYILREDYKILKDEQIEKFKLKKKEVLKLLAKKQQAVKKYVDEKELNYKEEEDVNEIITFYAEL